MKLLSLFVAKRVPRARTFGKHDGRRSMIVMAMFIQPLLNKKEHKLEYTSIAALISNTQLKILFCGSQLMIFAIKFKCIGTAALLISNTQLKVLFCDSQLILAIWRPTSASLCRVAKYVSFSMRKVLPCGYAVLDMKQVSFQYVMVSKFKDVCNIYRPFFTSANNSIQLLSLTQSASN